jgi:translocation and assembly module TamB
LIAGAGIALGPGAAWLVDHIADGQRVWRLGHIQADGVSGSWLGALRANHVAIADDHGVWLTANNIALEWRPQDIALGVLRIDTAHADAVAMLRQPVLLERRRANNASIDIRLGNARIDALNLSEAVFGETAVFTARLSLDVRDKSVQALDAALERVDSDKDRFIALYRPGDDYALRLDVQSAPSGIFARALGVAEQGLRAQAEGAGEAQTGNAQFTAHIGDATLLEGAASWTAAQWRFSAIAELDLLPALEPLAHRIGDRAAVEAAGARVGRSCANALPVNRLVRRTRCRWPARRRRSFYRND